MYLSHYDLNRMPFSISPDANLFWLSEKHTEGLATLKYGIYENKGFLVLTGNVGTGKTALINRLLRDIDVPVLIATISDPGLEGLDFFKFLAREFKLDGEFDTKGDFLIQFKNFLLHANASNQKVILIIDEVQRLNDDLLEQVRLLSNIEMDNKKLINIFFVGQSEFSKTLMKQQNEATRQRIAVRYHLKPLSAKETEEYILYRLEIAGATRQIFEPEAIRYAYYLSRGYPRIINVLCDRCLLTGYSRDLQSISASIVKECAIELKIPYVRKRPENKIQALPQKEEMKEPKNNSNFFSGSLKIAAAVLLAFLFGVTGYSTFESKNVQAVQTVNSENVISPVEKSDDTLEAQKEVSTPVEFAGKIPNPEQNNDVGKEEIEVAELSKESEKVFSLVEKSNYTFKPREEVLTPVTSTNEVLNTDQFKHSGRNEEKEIVELSKALIYFNHDSNELDGYSLEDLNSFSEFVLRHPESNVIIEGYTDSSGSSRYNRKLSKFRAEIVKNYLIAKGVSPLKIEAVGRGAENPLASNDTADGKEKNRRVEIRIATN